MVEGLMPKPKLYTMASLSLEIGKDRTVLGKSLALIDPDETKGDRKLYLMRTVVKALLDEATGKYNKASVEVERQMLADKAELLRIKLDTEKGLIVVISEVQSVLEPLFVAFKTRVLAIPTRLAKRLAGTKEASKIKVTLDKAVRSALEEVSSFNPSKIDVKGDKK